MLRLHIQVHIHIFGKTDIIMVHRKLKQDANQEIQKHVTFHHLRGLNLQEGITIGKFVENIKITHKGKYIKVKLIDLHISF